MNKKNMPAYCRLAARLPIALLTVLSLATPAMADTLPAALAEVYRSNTDLQAARAALRSVDEEVAIARSGYRPSLSIDATASQADQVEPFDPKHHFDAVYHRWFGSHIRSRP